MVSCHLVNHNSKRYDKTDMNYNEVNWAVHRKNGMLLVHKAHYSNLTKATLSGFVSSSKDLLQEKRT